MPSKASPEQMERAVQMYREGERVERVYAAAHISRGRLYAALHEAGVPL